MLFIEQRLVKDTKSKSFWAVETRKSSATFADMRKPLTGKKTGEIVMDSDILFRRLLAVSKQREVSMEDVLAHELAAVPPSLFHDDGSMRKTAKATLAKKLEATVGEASHLPDAASHSAHVMDGMVTLQSLNDSGFQTFNDLGELVLRKTLGLLNQNPNAHCVTIVYDRYDNSQSIKCFERERRGNTSNSKTHHITGTGNVPNYRLYLQSCGNKAALCLFVSNYIISAAPARLKVQDTIVLAGGFENGQDVRIVDHTGVHCLPELDSTHEEADTRMVLHAIHLSRNYQTIIVKSDDTDVLVLLIYYVSRQVFGTASIFMHAGHGDRQRFIPVSEISKRLGTALCESLPACHALTGCDTTSSLFKIGKTTALNKLEKNITELQGLKTFGLTDRLQESLPVARQYALSLYGPKKKVKGQPCASLDELRYILASTTDMPVAHLPPTEDAFEQHVLRAMYQTAIWCHSHVPKPVLWNPVGKGWIQKDDSTLQPVLFKKEPAPKAVRDLTHLYCTDKDCSESRKCQCVSVGLQCTEYCSCTYTHCPNAVD